ncbi:Kunitz/Bovine pancreatic trypsin inhibitor domain protein [Oesophagostomum dentatum]|uniref:Kunitz/Bovine pancreatic trypsin inhibitor domain protein n=1 Tax=Oesophagostomum dentatum TaxID=61180 RepID=A0A0B1SKI6_OESDE|nr:Kunitz/Bovine pancreatic trypsin inhibitor domain protein [Oesophagostomum dentatum]
MVSTTRYYFNLVTRQCTSFQYNGCSGNHNNFASKEQCQGFCSSAGCEAGEIVLKEPGSSRPLRCDNEIRNSCPATSQCRFNSVLAVSVCCGFITNSM